MRYLAIGILFAGVLATQASASILVFTDTMFGSNETPPNLSLASGQATVTVDTVANSLMVNESWAGLSGPATGAHIHCCGGPGVAAAIALPFLTFPTTASGTFNFTYDLTQTATYTSAFLISSGGTAAAAETTLIAGMLSGLTYTNIHDTNFPGGEIRGQLASVPEPGSMLFAVSGLLAGLAVLRRRRINM